jgi:putative transposase
MEWLTLDDVAKYEHEEYETIKKRYQAGHYPITKTEPPEHGGKDRVFIELSCLSKTGQASYKRHKKWIEKDYPRELSKKNEDYKPWFYDADIPSYIAKHKDSYTRAAKLAEIVEEFLENLPKKGKMEYAKPFLNKAGVQYKQFLYYIKLYKAGEEFGKIKTEETGENYEVYKIIALCRPTCEGQGSKITEDMKTVINRLWCDELYHKNNQTVEQLYESFKKVMGENGVTDIPCCRTIRRYLKKLEYSHGNEKALLKGGERFFKNTVMVKCQRDAGVLKVMELVQADAHKFDCWVEFTSESGEKTAIRPFLVGFIDTRSRCLVGYGICEQPNAEIIKQIIINMMKPKANTPIYGVPRVLLIDNGKDFTAQTLTGRNRKERFNIDIDMDIKGFYHMAGISEDKRALPYQPWTKAQIERVFGTITGRFSKRFASYTGTLTGSKTAGKVEKDIPKMLLRGELMAFDEFAAEFEKYVNQEYHQRQHDGLKKQGEPIPVPITVYTQAERYFKPAPPDEYMLSLLGQSEERLVNNVGIYLKNNTYTSEDLGRYVSQRVIVRYNARDLSSICVYDNDNKFICNAYKAELMHPLADSDSPKLLEHIKRQKRQLSAAKSNITEMQSAYVHGLELPALSETERKTVAIPDDKQYKERITEKAKKIEKKKRPELPEFLRAQAEKAIETMKEVR